MKVKKQMRTKTGRMKSVHEKRKARALTLVEMSVVIGILMILVSIGAVVWHNQSERAYRNATVRTLRDLLTALKMYRTDEGDFPPAGTCCNPLLTVKEGPYTNVTAIKSQFQSLSLERTGTPEAVCLSGKLAGIQPDYYVALCAETNDALNAKYKSINQPACCWTKGQAATFCDTDSNWYQCETKM